MTNMVDQILAIILIIVLVFLVISTIYLAILGAYDKDMEGYPQVPYEVFKTSYQLTPEKWKIKYLPVNMWDFKIKDPWREEDGIAVFYNGEQVDIGKIGYIKIRNQFRRKNKQDEKQEKIDVENKRVYKLNKDTIKVLDSISLDLDNVKDKIMKEVSNNE